MGVFPSLNGVFPSVGFQFVNKTSCILFDQTTPGPRSSPKNSKGDGQPFWVMGMN